MAAEEQKVNLLKYAIPVLISASIFVAVIATTSGDSEDELPGEADTELTAKADESGEKTTEPDGDSPEKLEKAKIEGASAKTSKDDVLKLHVRFEPGKVYYYRSSMVGEMQTDLQGMPSMVMTTTQDTEYKVKRTKDLAGGGYELESRILRIRSESDTAGQKSGFDTADTSSSDLPVEMTRMFEEMLELRCFATVDASHKVTSVRLSDPKFFDRPELAMAGGGISQEWFDTMMQDMLRTQAPREGLSPGESWSEAFEVSAGMGGDMKTDMSFTFDEWTQQGKNRVASISLTGSLELGDLAGGDSPIQYEISDGTITGSMIYDPTQGQIVKHVIEQEFSMSADMEGTSMSTSADTTTTMTLVEVRNE